MPCRTMRDVRGLLDSLLGRDPTLRRFDRAIVALLGVLGAVTLVTWVDPRIPTSIINPALDVAINVTATLVGGTVAILAWIRCREARRSSALYEAAAFTALTATNALMTGLVIAGQDAAFGLAPADPGAAPVYLWSLTRLAAGSLLLVGAARAVQGVALRFPAPAVAIGPAVGLMVGAIALVLAGQVTAEPSRLIVNALQLGGAAAFLGAAVHFRRLYARDRQSSDAVLVAGCLVAAFSQLHFAVDPVIATGVVTTGDLLRVAFHAILLYGIQAEIQSELVNARRANVELARLRDVDAAHATLAERARLARELHDGLAQDLWYAKLKQGRVAAATELGDETRLAARDVLVALDSALAEARQSVMAMRAGPASGSTLEEVLGSYVEDFGDRFGLRAEFEAAESLPRFSPRTEAEVLRIVQESLNNVRKHADATLVRVRADLRDGMVRLTVSDNGRGFDVDSVPEDRYGLRSMRERAEGVGAALAIDTRPSDGTRVVLDLPIGAHRNGVG